MRRLTGKIVLCGDGGVGKTSLRRAYLKGEFNANYLETLGADFTTKIVDIKHDNKDFQIKYLIWDLAGQPTFHSVRSNYFKGSHAILIVCDVTLRKSFNNINNWVEEIKKSYESTKLPPIVLLGNKIDLINPEVVEDSIKLSEGVNLAEILSSDIFNEEYDIPYIETSAKTGENVDKAFLLISKQLIINYLNGDEN
ncbi:MAG: Rab family GTPase [Candidatus Thorarchaeota archaeon]